MEELIFYAEENDSGKRADIFLGEAADISRSRAQKLAEDGNVIINGKATAKNYRMKTGDILCVRLPQAKEAEITAQNIPIDILYEDSDVIVVNKPQGMVVHPAAGHFSDTLANALMYHCGSSLSGINGVMRPGIVHRIDRDTSGILVAAKNDSAHISLAGQLSAHSMKRIYLGIVHNSLKGEEGTVIKPIGRHPKDRKRMAVLSDGGRYAVTHYKDIADSGGFSLAEFRLETGRTHQIRVHMAYIGHPILGDPVYGPRKCPLSLEGQTLHAVVLGFVHPRTGEYMEFKAKLPEYFKYALKKTGFEVDFDGF